MAKKTTVFASGTLYWASVIGDKQLKTNYDGDGKEWKMEFEPDDPSFLKEHRLLDRLKDPFAYIERLEERGEVEKAGKLREEFADRKDFLLLRKPELDKEGRKNAPFRIYDSDGNPWGEELLGNGTRADLKLNIMDWGPGKKKSIYCQAIRVTDHVPYEVDEFAAMDNSPAKSPSKPASTPKPKTKATAQEFEDLDDDIPF
jgi:hypothetical protein